MIPVPTAETRTAVTDRAGVIVNYRTGATVVLTGGALDEWLSAVRQGNAPKPVVVTNPGASWGTHETAARLESHGSPPWPWRVAALACVALTLTVRQTGRSEYRFGRLVRLASVGGALPPASAVHARTAVRSVRWAARAIPARVACLEESTAASVLLAAAWSWQRVAPWRRRRPDPASRLDLRRTRTPGGGTRAHWRLHPDQHSQLLWSRTAMSAPHILLPGERVSLAMTNRDHLPDYHRWENDPATILGYGTQVTQSWEVRAGGWEGQGRNRDYAQFEVITADDYAPVGLTTLQIDSAVRTAEFVILIAPESRGRAWPPRPPP